MRRREEIEYYKGLRATLRNNSLFSDAGQDKASLKPHYLVTLLPFYIFSSFPGHPLREGTHTSCCMLG